MQKLNRNIGSSFYTLQEHDWEYQVLSKSKVDLNQQYTPYYSGRNACLAILKEIESKQVINTIWLPNYYCDTVIIMIQQHYSDVQFYAVNPFGEFDTQVNFKAFAKSDDVLILNNFWGLSSFEYDISSKQRPVIIEDHTHGWMSEQSKNSKADYCICAIRKYYPIPTGGLAWKPNSEHPFDFYEDAIDENIMDAWHKFSRSMKLKSAYIKTGDLSVKDDYLALLNKGEALLSASNHFIKPLKTATDSYIKYIDKDPNQIKIKHLNHIYKNLKASQHFKVIKREGYTPFGLLLLFKNEDLFLNFKKELVSKDVFPAHLWPNTTIDSEWTYVFNIHVDYRYTIDDMDYIVKIINQWSNTNA